MAILDFPPIEQADEHGLLAIGGDLEPSSLKLAYSKGIFPWPINEQYPLAWFSPDPRGVLDFNDLKPSKSLLKIIRQKRFKVCFNHNFEAVIQEAASLVNRKDEEGTWITNEIIKSYTELFYLGHAYSVECYDESDSLVGGLYGFVDGHIVSGESMFYRVSNASKVALIAILTYLHKQGHYWLDTQMVTNVVASLGGKSIPRAAFLERLKGARNKRTSLFNGQVLNFETDLASYWSSR